MFPLYLRGHCNLTMLLSRHPDTDILTRTAYHMGFEFVRGSSNRGGVAALRELVRRSGRMNLAITPDGPRGPRRGLALGPVYLASKLGLPLVLMGFGYDRPWRLRTWDHHAIPLPFSRARAVVSPAISVPDNLDRGGLEQCRLQVEQLLNRLTLEAEAWAESGTHKLEEVPLRREPIRTDTSVRRCFGWLGILPSRCRLSVWARRGRMQTGPSARSATSRQSSRASWCRPTRSDYRFKWPSWAARWALWVFTRSYQSAPS